jgi:hypothetical protein
MWNTPMHLLILAVVVVVLFGGRKIRPRRPPTHPLPVTSPIETSRTAAPKERPWQALARGLRLR